MALKDTPKTTALMKCSKEILEGRPPDAVPLLAGQTCTLASKPNHVCEAAKASSPGPIPMPWGHQEPGSRETAQQAQGGRERARSPWGGRDSVRK